jgi:hypothetical protein
VHLFQVASRKVTRDKICRLTTLSLFGVVLLCVSCDRLLITGFNHFHGISYSTDSSSQCRESFGRVSSKSDVNRSSNALQQLHNQAPPPQTHFQTSDFQRTRDLAARMSPLVSIARSSRIGSGSRQVCNKTRKLPDTLSITQHTAACEIPLRGAVEFVCC